MAFTIAAVNVDRIRSHEAKLAEDRVKAIALSLRRVLRARPMQAFRAFRGRIAIALERMGEVFFR